MVANVLSSSLHMRFLIQPTPVADVPRNYGDVHPEDHARAARPLDNRQAAGSSNGRAGLSG
jgi:hypothetical protein